MLVRLLVVVMGHRECGPGAGGRVCGGQRGGRGGFCQPSFSVRLVKTCMVRTGEVWM